MPKSINTQSMPSVLYSSCSSTNMWWLKNCCSFSLVKLIQSCSNPLNYVHTHLYTGTKQMVKKGDQHYGALAHKRSQGFGLAQFTFSISSIQAARSMPKSINTQSIPSCLYSSCSSTNMWWLKNCCSFSLVKLMQSCSKPLYYFRKNAIPQFESNLHYTVCVWLVLKAC